MAGRRATLYRAPRADCPLVVLNVVEGDGAAVFAALGDGGAPTANLLVMSGLEWARDMTPWAAPALTRDSEPAGGGADAYLKVLVDEVLPWARDRVNGIPAHTGIAGYSYGGLFALYALTACDAFDRAASMSGSLWFPDFVAYASAHMPLRPPTRIYLSLGTKEARAKHPLLKTVRTCTEELVARYRADGIDVTFELNPGGHFAHVVERTARGIAAISG